jgi:hypothetical protein
MAGEGPSLDGRKTAQMPDLSKVHVEGRLLDVEFAAIDQSSSGDTTVVGAVTGKTIRVLGFWTVVGGATALQWKDGAAVDLSGSFALATNGGCAIENQFGIMDTTNGQALILNSSAAVAVGGTVTYVLI